MIQPYNTRRYKSSEGESPSNYTEHTHYIQAAGHLRVNGLDAILLGRALRDVLGHEEQRNITDASAIKILFDLF